MQECFQKYPEIYSKFTDDDEEEEEEERRTADTVTSLKPTTDSSPAAGLNGSHGNKTDVTVE